MSAQVLRSLRRGLDVGYAYMEQHPRLLAVAASDATVDRSGGALIDEPVAAGL